MGYPSYVLWLDLCFILDFCVFEFDYTCREAIEIRKGGGQMTVFCPVCGAIVYVGYSTHVCGKCGYDGKQGGWNDVIVWLNYF